jgi:hypothetical protein
MIKVLTGRSWIMIALGVGVVSLAWALNEVIPRDVFLPASEVQKRWGELPFDAARFKVGDDALRAKMAVSMLKNPRSFLGKSSTEIREMLGGPTGHYRWDVNPAYMISEIGPPKPEAWQILFFLDKDRKVRELKVHRNCCD